MKRREITRERRAFGDEDGVGYYGNTGNTGENDVQEGEQGLAVPNKKPGVKKLKKALAGLSFDQLLDVQQQIGKKAFDQAFKSMANNDDTSSRAAIAKRRREEASRRGHSDQEDEDSAVDEQDDDNLDAGSIKSIEEDQEDQSEDGHGDSEDEDNDDDEDRDGDDKNEEVAEDLPEWAKSRARPEKRADKNQPIEISSKKPVSRRRQVVEIKRMNYMDPRFEKRAGNFNEDLFKKSYGFLDEYRDSEIQMLKQEIAREKGEWRRESLSKTLQRMLSQQETRAAKERTQKLKSEWRKTEVEQIRAGKKKAPYFLKKSDVKKLELMEKFSAVGGNAAGGPGKKGNALALDKFLEKKRKRKAAKERVLLPRTRRSAQEE